MSREFGFGNAVDSSEAIEFILGAHAKRRQARNDTAGAIVAGVLSAALFSHLSKKKGR